MRLTATQSRDELVTKAKSDFGDFLAVKYLLPVAIEGAVSQLSTVHADLYNQWQVDQTKRAAGTVDLTFTNEYLADRAAFLTWKNKLATEDFDGTTGAYSKAPDAYFKDLGSNLLINLGSGGSLTDKPRDIFGADQASGATENLAGGSKADRLYGGGGMDILNGDAGDDYLEGNSGDTNIRHANGDASSICRIFFGQALNESEWRVTA